MLPKLAILEKTPRIDMYPYVHTYRTRGALSSKDFSASHLGEESEWNIGGKTPKILKNPLQDSQ